jgi:hypothetical protein
MIAAMRSTAAILEKRRAAVEQGQRTKRRNNALRNSTTGRLLLVLERCVSLTRSGVEIDKRRFSRILNELRYACKLADQAGIRKGTVIDSFGMFSLVFELSGGDIVLSTVDERLCADAFPREPIIGDNSRVLAECIAALMMQTPCSI